MQVFELTARRQTQMHPDSNNINNDNNNNNDDDDGAQQTYDAIGSSPCILATIKCMRCVRCACAAAAPS